MAIGVINLHLHSHIFNTLVLMLFLLCVDIFIPTEQISFNYSNFKDEQTARADTNNICDDPGRKICLFGNARVQHGGINVDCSINEEWGGAITYSESIQLWNKQTNKIARFTSEFIFTIVYTDDNTSFGNLAFFMSGFPFQNSPGYLALGNGTSSFIAVNLEQESDQMGRDRIQLALLLNSEVIVKKVIIMVDYDAIAKNGTGRIVVDYDSVNTNLSVSIDANDNANFFHIIDLSKILPENVTIGFISAPHIHLGDNIIQAWNVSSNFNINKEEASIIEEEQVYQPNYSAAYRYVKRAYRLYLKRAYQQYYDQPDPPFYREAYQLSYREAYQPSYREAYPPPYYESTYPPPYYESTYPPPYYESTYPPPYEAANPPLYERADPLSNGEIEGNTSGSKWLVAGVIIVMVSLISLMSTVTLFLWKHKMRKETKGREVGKTDTDKEKEDRILDTEFADAEEGARKLSYDELEKATNNFSSKRKLGEGGFGPVYSGFLKYRNTNVAIKRISGHSKQGKKEYIAEVKIISQLRHKNMVQLVGWCHENGQLLLVYELMENGSLESFIFDHQKTLSWPLRRNIAKGLASALIYLHQDWKQCVVHRDVKAGNVMLDKTFEAKLGDFGLARLSDHGGGVQTTFMAGTMGYMAPECFITGKAGKESDVYAFGIVALEIACGRKCIDHTAKANKVRLVEWVWKMYGSGSLVDVVDERILNDEDYDEQEVKQLLMVGLCCAHPDLEQRPSMSHALAILNFQGSLPTLPMEMPRVGFTVSRQQSNISDTTSFISTVELSNNR